jgi:hypothetical protein
MPPPRGDCGATLIKGLVVLALVALLGFLFFKDTIMAYLAERNNNEESDWRKRVIRLYKDSQLKGEKREFSYAVDGGQIDLEEEQFNNTISSVVLPRGVCVEFFENRACSGSAARKYCGSADGVTKNYVNGDTYSCLIISEDTSVQDDA